MSSLFVGAKHNPNHEHIKPSLIRGLIVVKITHFFNPGKWPTTIILQYFHSFWLNRSMISVKNANLGVSLLKLQRICVKTLTADLT